MCSKIAFTFHVRKTWAFRFLFVAARCVAPVWKVGALWLARRAASQLTFRTEVCDKPFPPGHNGWMEPST